MRNLKKTRRIQVIVIAALPLSIGAGLIGYGPSDGINFFLSPTHVVNDKPSESETFRIGGLV